MLNLDFSVTCNEEQRFFDIVSKSKTPNDLLLRFGVQYHYFSLHQIHAFCGILRMFGPDDRHIAAVLAEVIYEELGEGDTQRIHSVILENFLREVGADVSALPLHRSAVVDGVTAYVEELYSAFWGQDRAIALATYCFLENSAVHTYPALESILTLCGISREGCEFFHLHTGLEVEHAATAEKLAKSLIKQPSEIDIFNTQFSKMRQIWERFWKDVANYASA